MSNQKRFLAFLLSLALTFSLCASAWAEGSTGADASASQTTPTATANEEDADSKSETETIPIATAADFLTFANNCRTDSWSKNKTVMLQADISLSGTDFAPIASFSGVFKGNGHTISGLSFSGHLSSAGLFAQVEKGAKIMDLNVTGTVNMASSCETAGGIAGYNKGTIQSCSFSGSVQGSTCVGGICGTNEISGQIRSCMSSGSVTGVTETGGIAGENNGAVSACTNTAYVNTSSEDSTISLSDINLDFSLDTNQLASGNNIMSLVTDSGGIAGYNTGTLINCTNESLVGYQHVGYNVGGIAGRSCGFVKSCTNTGSVYGRKDVGGIVGQVEPYILTEMSASTLATLQQQLQELSALVNQAVNDAQNGSSEVASQLDDLASSVEYAIYKADNTVVNIGGSASTDTAADNNVTDGTASGNASTDAATANDGNSLPHKPKARYLNSNTISLRSDESSDTPVNIPDYDDSSSDPVNIPEDIWDDYQASDSDDTSGSSGTSDTTEPSDTSGSEPSDSGSPINISEDDLGNIISDIESNIENFITQDLSGVIEAVNNFGSQLSAINGALSSTVGVVADDVRLINSKFNEVTDTLFNAVYAMNTASDLVEDASDLDVDMVTLGKLLRCTNTGTIQGDIDVGGIAGTMARDSLDDQEDDTMEDVSTATQNAYKLKAIIQNCTNNGTVEAKRSYAGGICGRMALGLITSDKNYGNISSESGDYVGGITGIASSTVRNCYADCTLSGGEYVGGITGSGVTDSLSGETSTITGCYSMVEIVACTQYAGAISGANAGSYYENYFVSDTLQGIDGLNYSGKAEGITYQQLMQVENLPDGMKRLTLSFVADGKVIKTVEFQYGNSFGADIYPEIPVKDGYYGVWDRTTLENLHFNTVVSVNYMEYTTALPCDTTRENGRPVFIALGDFDEDAELTARSETQSVADFAPLSNGVKEATKHYFATISGHKFFETAVNLSVEEQWVITLPDDGQASHIVRYLSPDGSTDHIDLYVKQADGSWKLLECGTFGTCLEFTLEGTSAEIAVVHVLPIVWIWLSIFGGVLLLVLMVVLFTRRVHRIHQKVQKRRAARAASREAVNEENESAEDEDYTIGKNGKKRKKRRIRAWQIPLIIFLVLVIVVACIIGHYVHALGGSLVPYTMLRELSQRSDLTMQMQLDTILGGQDTSLSANLTTVSTNSGKVTAVTADGLTFYYANGAVILENGRAFRMENSFPDYSSLLNVMVPMLHDSEITMDSSEKNTWVVSLTNAGAQTLLNTLLPTIGSSVADTQQAQLTLKAADTSITEIDLDLEGHLSDENATAFTLHAAANNFGSGSVTLPEAVRSTVNSGLTGNEPVVTEDVLKLATAWAELNGRNITAADVALKVNAGPLMLNDALTYAAKNAENGQRVWHISKNLVNIYGSDSGVVTEDGKPITSDEAELTGVKSMMDMAYTICLEGNLTRTINGDMTTYTVTLGGSDMMKLAETAVPQLASQNVTLSYGTLTLTLKDGVITSLVLNCTGSVRVLLVDADVSITDTITFTDGSGKDFDIPSAVLTALTPEE